MEAIGHSGDMNMHPFITAALMMCSTGDLQIAEKIVVESIIQDVNVAVTLSIGIMESGLSGDNPMGVSGCHERMQNKKLANNCIRSGVVSIKNRIIATKVSLPSKKALHHCKNTGNINLCRALIVYNGSKNKFVYARNVMKLIRKLYKISGQSIPSV